MSLFDLFLYLILIKLTISKPIVCKSKYCKNIITAHEDIICTNDVEICEINCIGQKSCLFPNKKLKIFSGAQQTYINCIGKDACVGIQIYIGELSGRNLPNGYNAIDFIGPKTSGIVNCDGVTSCKEAKIISQGIY